MGKHNFSHQGVRLLVKNPCVVFQARPQAVTKVSPSRAHGGKSHPPRSRLGDSQGPAVSEGTCSPRLRPLTWRERGEGTADPRSSGSAHPSHAQSRRTCLKLKGKPRPLPSTASLGNPSPCIYRGLQCPAPRCHPPPARPGSSPFSSHISFSLCSCSSLLLLEKPFPQPCFPLRLPMSLSPPLRCTAGGKVGRTSFTIFK